MVQKYNSLFLIVLAVGYQNPGYYPFDRHVEQHYFLVAGGIFWLLGIF